MTRAEMRIAAAKKRAKEAEEALSRIYKRRREAQNAIERKMRPIVDAAERREREAKQAVAVAELAARGIVPMQTIVLWHPKGYISPTVQHRYVVRVRREGWTVFVRVGKNGRIMENRLEISGPSGWSWKQVTVTDQVLKP